MASSTTRSENATAAIVFAGFAVVCIVAFLSFRGGDLGKLGTLAGNLGGGPMFGLSLEQQRMSIQRTIKRHVENYWQRNKRTAINAKNTNSTLPVRPAVPQPSQ